MAVKLRWDWGNRENKTTGALSEPSLTDVKSGVVLALTRATIAKVEDWEQILREVSSGEERFTGARRVENLATQSDDFSDADWTKSNITAGVSSLLATDANGTALQSYTALEGADYLFAVNIQRVTGTGDIDLTVDGGATWTTVSVTGTDTQFSRLETGLSAGATSFGIRVVTDTDEVNVSLAQLENASGQATQTPSEYQATTTAAVSKWYATNKSGAAINPTGLLVEEARTNISLHSSDVSNAVWVASNVTKGSTSVEAPDGTDNTTVRLTASAANGTILQSITSGSATRAYAVYMKRVTGTGNIDLTVDNGSTWTTKTLTSSWQRFDITQAAVTNPIIGVRIVTSADAIDFWGSDLQTGLFSTSYIPTVASSVTRNAEAVSTADVTAFNTDGTGTYYVQARNDHIGVGGSANDWGIFWLSQGSNLNRVFSTFNNGSGANFIGMTTSGDDVFATNGTVIVSVASRSVFAFAEDDFKGYLDGSVGVTDTSADLLGIAPDDFSIGQANSTAVYLNGNIAEFIFDDIRLVNGTLEDWSNGTNLPVSANITGIQYPRDAMPTDTTRFNDFITDSGVTKTGDLQLDYRAALFTVAGLSGKVNDYSLNDAFKRYFESL